MLEALGIGAGDRWEQRMAAYGELSNGGSGSDLAFRSRSSENASHLAAAVLEKGANPDRERMTRMLRALHFQVASPVRNQAYGVLFEKGDPEMALFAAAQLGPDAIGKLDGGPERLDQLLAPIRGTPEFVNLAEQLNLTGFPDELAAFIAAHPEAPESVKAAQLLLQTNRGKLVSYLRDSGNLPRASAVAQALGKTGDRAVGGLLAAELNRSETPALLAIELVNAMAMNGRSGRDLLRLAQEGKLDESLKPVAALAIARSPDAGLRNDAREILPVPQAAGAENFPPLPELVAKKGDASKGPELFAKATCATCHQVKEEGIAFGPDLTEIGNKLSREGMFEAILFPSAAISHGFHGVSITKKDGSALVGYFTGETDEEVQLRLPGGVDQSVDKAAIAKREELHQSLMPPGLAAIIGTEGLVDLVTWLETLK